MRKRTWLLIALVGLGLSAAGAADLIYNGAQVLRAVTKYLGESPTVVAALVASVIAIVAARTTLHGVQLSLKATEEKTQKELAHSASQEARNREHSRNEAARERDHGLAKARHDRLTAMRREVYLAAVTEMVRLQTLLGSLANGDLTKMDVSGAIAGVSTVVQRMVIVAEQDTAARARELLTAYMRVLMRCVAEVIPLGGLNGRITSLEVLQKHALERGEQYLEAMRQFNLARRTDRAEFEAIQRQQDASREEVKRFSAELDQLNGKRVAAQLAFLDHVNSQMRAEIADRLDVLAVALRSELELASDLELFRAQTAATYHEVDSAVEAFKSSIIAAQERT